MLARFALSLAVLVISVLVLVVPVVRMRLRYGVTGVAVHRAVTPVQRTLGAALGLFFVCLAAFSVAHAVAPRDVLGLWPAPPWLAALGWSLLALGVVVIAVAQAQMGRSWRIGIDDARTDLVVSGLYRVSRNPIYSGMGLALFGTIAIAPSGITLVLAVQGAALLCLETRLEEEHLARTHGRAFREYTARVGRFVPFVGRLGPSERGGATTSRRAWGARRGLGGSTSGPAPRTPRPGLVARPAAAPGRARHPPRLSPPAARSCASRSLSDRPSRRRRTPAPRLPERRARAGAPEGSRRHGRCTRDRSWTGTSRVRLRSRKRRCGRTLRKRRRLLRGASSRARVRP